MLYIVSSVLQSVVDHCQAVYPQEGCGALIGSVNDDGDIMIVRWQAIANRASEPSRSFLFDESEWTGLLFATQKSRQSIVGLFHSHPHTPAQPSASDQAGYWHTIPVHWIISLASFATPQVAAFNCSPSSAANWTPCPYEVISMPA